MMAGNPDRTSRAGRGRIASPKSGHPEVGVIEELAVLDGPVGEHELPDLSHVLHQRRDLELRSPGGVAEHGDVLIRMRAVRLDVRLEEPRVRDIVIVEEENEGALGGEETEVLGGRDAGVGDTQATELELRRGTAADRVRPVARAVVHDDDLEVRERECLPGEAFERALEERAR